MGFELQACVGSNLFRFGAFVFLRIIPSKYALYFTGALFAHYVACVAFQLSQSKAASNDAPQVEAVVAVVEETVVAATKEEHHATEPNGTSIDEKKEETATETEPLVVLKEEQVDVLVVERVERSACLTILGSLPTKKQHLVFLTFMLNAALALMVADFTARPFAFSYGDVTFTRVGAVSHDYAKIQARYPTLVDGLAQIQWRQATKADAPWKNGPVFNFTAENDFVAVGKLSGLWPSTPYEYRFVDSNSTDLPYPPKPIAFRTFPDPRLGTGSSFKFLVSSCVMPNFPYSPIHGNRIKGFELLADYVWPRSRVAAPVPSSTAPATAQPSAEPVVPPKLENTRTSGEATDAIPSAQAVLSQSVSSVTDTAGATPVPSHKLLSTSVAAITAAPKPVPTSDARTEFLLVLGDFIYADVPLKTNSYERLYRRVFASQSFRRVYERLPMFTIYDDHEIKNNYAGNGNDSAPPFPVAVNAYHAYTGQANPDSAYGANYYDFRHGDTAFFVMDTRRYRSPQDHDSEAATKTMLGDQQLAALHAWLGKVNSTATFKFVITSVPFTKLWGLDAKTDSWAGYRAERAQLLELFSHVPNVVVLSGDRHEFAAIEFLGGQVLEFSTSPLSMFAVPLFRTLRMQSEETFARNVSKLVANEEGRQETVQEEVRYPEERVLKYLPMGNYKFSSIEVDTTNPAEPKLIVEAIINGVSQFRLDWVGQPVKLRSNNAIGQQLTQGVKDMLEKIGLRPSKWF